MDSIPFSKETEDTILGNVIMYNEVYDSVAPYLRDDKTLYQGQAKLLWDRIIELKKEEKKLMLKTTKSIEHIDDGGYQETNIDEDIDNARCLNHYK